MKVLKFGTRTVSSAERLKTVAKIVSEKEKSIVIVSAMPEVTLLLEDISNYFYNKNTEGANESINGLSTLLYSLPEKLYKENDTIQNAKSFIEEIIHQIRSFSNNLFTVFEQRIVLAQGELLNSKLFYLLLKEQGKSVIELSALDFIKTDKNYEPDVEYIKNQLVRLIEEKKADYYITQGYISRNAYGEIDDLRKGGNDYTAALVGVAIQATEVQLWEDVDNMYKNDPQIVSNTSTVSTLNFEEAAELAYFSSKIVHPSSILPLKQANIPVRLMNILKPESQGTLITSVTEKGTIKAVAAKDNITTIRIKSSKMLLAHGFLKKIFEIFDEYQTSIDMLTSSEIGVSVTIDNTKYLDKITTDLKKYGTVNAQSAMCTICVVGDFTEGQNNKKLLDIIKDLPVSMISYGASDYNFSFLIEGKNKQEVLQTLDNKLF